LPNEIANADTREWVDDGGLPVREDEPLLTASNRDVADSRPSENGVRSRFAHEP